MIPDADPAVAVRTLARERADLLAEVATIACGGLELEGFAAALARLSASATAARSCRVYVLSQDARELNLAGVHPATSAHPYRLELGAGAAGWAAAHATARRIEAGEGWLVLAVPVFDPAAGAVAAIEAEIASEPDSPAREASNQAERTLELLGACLAPRLARARRVRRTADRAESAERFAERAVNAQEDERARLAREIHDGVAQRLAGVGFHLSAAASLLPRDPQGAQVQIRAARALLDLAGEETRAAIGGLRPPVLDDLGLPAALASLAGTLGALSGAPEITVTIVGELDHPMPDHLQTALYRIAQEALGNILRHAAASSADVALELGPHGVLLSVTDDGHGFGLEPGPAAAEGRTDSFGLRSMRERAELVGGTLAVSSHRDRGTSVRVAVPLSHPATPAPAMSATAPVVPPRAFPALRHPPAVDPEEGWGP